MGGGGRRWEAVGVGGSHYCHSQTVFGFVRAHAGGNDFVSVIAALGRECRPVVLFAVASGAPRATDYAAAVSGLWGVICGICGICRLVTASAMQRLAGR